MTLIDMNARWDKYYTEHSEEKPKYFQNPEFNEFLQSSRLKLEIEERDTEISQGTAQEKTTTGIITKFKVDRLTLVDNPLGLLQVISRKYQRKERCNYDAGVSVLYLNILKRGYYCGLETLASIPALDGEVQKGFVFLTVRFRLKNFINEIFPSVTEITLILFLNKLKLRIMFPLSSPSKVLLILWGQRSFPMLMEKKKKNIAN